MPKGSQTDRTNVERAVAHEEIMEGSGRRMRREAREKLGPFLGEMLPWDLFATLTYDPKRVERGVPPSFYAVERHIIRWLVECREGVGGRDLAAVFGLESHVNGWPHAHGVIHVGGLKGYELRTMGPLWFRKHGFVKLERPRSRTGTATYCAKYVLKEENVTFVFFGRLPQARFWLFREWVTAYRQESDGKEGSDGDD
jgi:hypothetical protein